jgi:putative transport protein
MHWFVDLFLNSHGVAHAVVIVAAIAAIGLAIGHVKVKGASLGIAGVLFVGLLVAHFGIRIDHDVLEFLRDFGLVLFVFTIGLQVGPGFFASLRRQGPALNLAAGAIVLGGAGMTVLLYALLMPRSALPAAMGLLSGATTNTPSMAAAQATFAEHAKARTPASDAVAATQPATTAPTATSEPYADADAVIGSAYAIAYPLGICGVLLTMVLIRKLFRIDVMDEQRLLAAMDDQHPALDVCNIELGNPALIGRTIREVPTVGKNGVVITRLLRDGRVEIARSDMALQAGDVMTVVGPADALADMEMILGKRTTIDVRAISGDITSQAFLVSNRSAAGRTIADLALGERFGVRVTRILRSGVELPVTTSARLQVGDRIMTVGQREHMAAVASEVGNNIKVLDKPMLIPIFIGLALGVIVGTLPMNVGLPMPVRLGLAGGPLIVAILLSRIHRIGPLVWFMPDSANYMLRELGIVVFLACAGLKSGGTFAETLRAHGVQWLLIGSLITIVPTLTVGLIARGVFKMNYLTLCGMLAGSMTDPPALSFATQITRSDAPTIAYVTVYPLVMLMRVLLAQAIVIWLSL